MVMGGNPSNKLVPYLHPKPSGMQEGLPSLPFGLLILSSAGGIQISILPAIGDRRPSLGLMLTQVFNISGVATATLATVATLGG